MILRVVLFSLAFFLTMPSYAQGNAPVGIDGWQWEQMMKEHDNLVNVAIDMAPKTSNGIHIRIDLSYRPYKLLSKVAKKASTPDTPIIVYDLHAIMPNSLLYSAKDIAELIWQNGYNNVYFIKPFWYDQRDDEVFEITTRDIPVVMTADNKNIFEHLQKMQEDRIAEIDFEQNRTGE